MSNNKQGLAKEEAATISELWTELTQFGYDIKYLQALNPSYLELMDFVMGLRKLRNGGFN